jgi:glutathione S-transferase
LAADGEGDEAGLGGPEQDQERPQASGARGADGVGPEEPGAGRAPGGEDEAPIRIVFKGFITLRRVRIKPDKKREEYVARLERIITACEEALTDSDALEEAQLKAADVIIRAIRMSYVIVREVDIENLERVAQEIKRRLDERARQGQAGLGG